VPALASMQAHALLIAEQPEQARELLTALAKKQALAPVDRLHLGLAMLAGKGNNREALEHLEAAQQALGGHPRAQVGLAMALYRVDRTEEALAALEAARVGLGEAPEAFDEGLVERASKQMRTVQKAQQKRGGGKMRRGRLAREQWWGRRLRHRWRRRAGGAGQGEEERSQGQERRASGGSPRGEGREAEAAAGKGKGKGKATQGKADAVAQVKAIPVKAEVAAPVKAEWRRR
jgi:tetratricopeptide (TPR) repeat protein